jgi:nitroreductase
MMGPMQLAEVIRRRRMVRRYTDQPVDPAVVDRALEHAIRAPSAGFSQGWAFLLLDSLDDVRRFWASTTPVGADPDHGPDAGGPDADPDSGDDGWLAGMSRAPVVIVALSCKAAYLDRYAEPDKGWTDRDENRWPAPYWDIDTGMAALLVLLTAVDEGLGACFFGVPPDRIDAFREEFGVPTDHSPIGAITVGHPAPETVSGSARTRPRRTVADVVHRGRW